MGPNSSPQSPFFFLHHYFLDCLYRQWQALDPNNRLSDYYGNLGDADQVDGPFRAKLTDVLHMHGLALDLTVADVIDAQGGVLCYEVGVVVVVLQIRSVVLNPHSSYFKQCNLKGLLPWLSHSQY